MQHLHYIKFTPQHLDAPVVEQQPNFFLDFIPSHIMENIDDVERVAWVFVFWRDLQRRRLAHRCVWIDQVLQSLPVQRTKLLQRVLCVTVVVNVTPLCLWPSLSINLKEKNNNKIEGVKVK